ncbi:RNA 3'-terminal phosphate cyclase, partial [Kipferlia bialata]|eukprot:g17007.t1
MTELSPADFTRRGLVKKIRGTIPSARVSQAFGKRALYACRGIFNEVLSDVYIETDHSKGP